MYVGSINSVIVDIMKYAGIAMKTKFVRIYLVKSFHVPSLAITGKYVMIIE